MTRDYVDTTSITHLSLCTGYGGIDLGLARVVSNLRTIAYCEREAAAIELLLSRMENGQLDAAPIWTDLRSFPWEAFSDRVDILSGGYPCQPFSAAGKRLGAEDERHLWPAIADGIRILRPRVCFFENVEGHISLGLREVISELEGLGYRTAWGIFSAAEVGAPHQRKRVFIMAHNLNRGCLPSWISGSVAGVRAGGAHDSGAAAKPSPQLAHCINTRPQGWLRGWEDSGRKGEHGHVGCGSAGVFGGWPSRPGEPQYWWEPPRVVADARRDQCERRSPVGEVSSGDDGAQGAGEESGSRGQDEAGERTLTESGGIGAEPAVGNANRGRQSSGINAGGGCSEDCRREGDIEQAKPREVEPEVGGGTHGAADWVDYGKLCISSNNRTDELRMLGNGVVPATAARAFLTLMEELNNSHEQNRATTR